MQMEDALISLSEKIKLPENIKKRNVRICETFMNNLHAEFADNIFYWSITGSVAKGTDIIFSDVDIVLFINSSASSNQNFKTIKEKIIDMIQQEYPVDIRTIAVRVRLNKILHVDVVFLEFNNHSANCKSTSETDVDKIKCIQTHFLKVHPVESSVTCPKELLKLNAAFVLNSAQFVIKKLADNPGRLIHLIRLLKLWSLTLIVSKAANRRIKGKSVLMEHVAINVYEHEQNHNASLLKLLEEAFKLLADPNSMRIIHQNPDKNITSAHLDEKINYLELEHPIVMNVCVYVL